MLREGLKQKLEFNNVSDTVADLMLEYEERQSKKKCGDRTILEENRNINRFFEWYSKHSKVRKVKLSNIQTMKGMTIQEYVDWLASDQKDRDGYKNATIRKYMANVGSFMKHLVKYGHIDYNPVSGNIDLPFEQPDKIYYSQSEGKAIIDAIQDSERGTPLQNKAIAMMMFWQGLRINEISTFKLDNYTDYKDQGLIRVLGKGRGSSKVRVITLFKDVEQAIDAYLESGERRGGGEYLFTTDKFKASGNFRSVSHIRNLVNDARLETGFCDITPHKYRKLLVERLIDAGIELEMASKILGHADVSTTKKHYLQAQEGKQMQSIRDIMG